MRNNGIRTNRPSVRIGYKNCKAVRDLKKKWKTKNYDQTVERIFTRCSELDPQFKKELIDIEYLTMETKLNEDAAIVT